MGNIVPEIPGVSGVSPDFISETIRRNIILEYKIVEAENKLADLEYARYLLIPWGGRYWGITCVTCNISVMRDPFEDALFWIDVHEEEVEHEVKSV